VLLILIWLPVIAIGAVFVLALVSLYFVDKLIDHQCVHQREDWMAVGRPIGGHASGVDSTFWRGRFFRTAVISWVWSTPTWVKDDEESQRPLGFIRITWIAGLALVAASFLLFWR
jgi:hypothetical protein